MGFNSEGPNDDIDVDDSDEDEDDIDEDAVLAILTNKSPSSSKLNQSVVWHLSPLHAAAYRGLKSVVSKLLEPECGADLHLNGCAGAAWQSLLKQCKGIVVAELNSISVEVTQNEIWIGGAFEKRLAHHRNSTVQVRWNKPRSQIASPFVVPPILHR